MEPGFDAAGGGVQRVRGDAHLDETLDEFHLHQVSAPSAQEPRGHRSGAHRHRVLDGVHVRLRGAERDSRVRRRADRGGGSAQPLLLRRRRAAPVDQKLRLRLGISKRVQVERCQWYNFLKYHKVFKIDFMYLIIYFTLNQTNYE